MMLSYVLLLSNYCVDGVLQRCVPVRAHVSCLATDPNNVYVSVVSTLMIVAFARVL
jgi:hypothetical protein